MGHKHSKRIEADDILRDGKEAKQMIELLDAFANELDASAEFLRFFSRLLDRHYSKHGRLRRQIAQTRVNLNGNAGKLKNLKKEYRQYLADFEHQYGPIEAPSLIGIFNYSISIGDLLELFPIDDVVEDFLDG